MPHPRKLHAKGSRKIEVGIKSDGAKVFQSPFGILQCVKRQCRLVLGVAAPLA